MEFIYVGHGSTAPGAMIDGVRKWHFTKVYVQPLIGGISENLWKRIYNETNDIRPMYGHDGSAVYVDGWQIVRKIGSKIIPIANITEEG